MSTQTTYSESPIFNSVFDGLCHRIHQNEYSPKIERVKSEAMQRILDNFPSPKNENEAVEFEERVKNAWK